MNSSVQRRGQRMSKRDMSAQRAEESSRQSLQIMQPAGLNHSSQRTRNHSGTVRQARKLLLQIEQPASLTTRQRSGRQSGSQAQRPRISDQLVVGPAGDAAALRPAFRCPTGLALFHQHRQRYSGNMSIESSAARAIQRNEAAKKISGGASSRSYASRVHALGHRKQT